MSFEPSFTVTHTITADFTRIEHGPSCDKAVNIEL